MGENPPEDDPDFIKELSRERPMFNPQLTQGFGFNPVFSFAISKRLVCTPSNKLKATFPPADTLSKKSAEFTEIGAACGFVIIQYENGKVTYASIFAVGPKLLCSSFHNTLPSLVDNSPVVEYYFSPSVSLPPRITEAITEDQRELHNIFRIHLLPRKVDYPDLPPYKDVDPRSRLEREDFADFAFFVVTDPAYTPSDYLVPYHKPIELGHEVAVVGWSSEVPPRVYSMMFLGLKEVPSADDIRRHFFGYTHKLAAPSAVLAPVEDGKQRLLVHNASTMPAASGSVVFSLTTNSFVGVHAGSVAPVLLLTDEAKERVLGGTIESSDFTTPPNYNLCVSVHHPFFVLEYVRHVVLSFEGIPDKILPYLQFHKGLIKKYFPSLPL